MEKFVTEQERIEFLIGKAHQKTKPTQQPSVIALLSEAIQKIKCLPNVDSRTHYLIEVANTYRILDLKDLSLAVLEEGLNNAQNCENDNVKAIDLSEIGYQFVALGLVSKGFELLETALNLATNLEDIDERDLILCDVARNYGDSGRIDLALNVARLVQDDYRVIFRILEPLRIEPSEFFSTTNP